VLHGTSAGSTGIVRGVETDMESASRTPDSLEGKGANHDTQFRAGPATRGRHERDTARLERCSRRRFPALSREHGSSPRAASQSASGPDLAAPVPPLPDPPPRPLSNPLGKRYPRQSPPGAAMHVLGVPSGRGQSVRVDMPRHWCFTRHRGCKSRARPADDLEIVAPRLTGEQLPCDLRTETGASPGPARTT
jgi:hypothetical protein